MVKVKDVVEGRPYLWVQERTTVFTRHKTPITLMGIVKVTKVIRRKSDLYWIGEVVAPLWKGKHLSNHGKFGELYELNKLRKYKDIKGFRFDPRRLPGIIIFRIFSPME